MWVHLTWSLRAETTSWNGWPLRHYLTRLLPPTVMCKSVRQTIVPYVHVQVTCHKTVACALWATDMLYYTYFTAQVVIWCDTVGASDCGGYPLWGDPAWGPLLSAHEWNENALPSALCSGNVSVWECDMYIIYGAKCYVCMYDIEAQSTLTFFPTVMTWCWSAGGGTLWIVHTSLSYMRNSKTLLHLK